MTAQNCSWGYLPQEIRLVILEALVEDKGSIARFSAVCREWQSIVEQKNFSRIKLTVPRIPMFSDMVHQRRQFVKYIWLCIELEEYDCSMCDQMDTDERVECNMAIITRVMIELFSVLSKWEPAGNLSLDIGVYSLSDLTHYYKKLYLASDAFSEPDDEQLATNPHDPRHGWIEGQLVSRPPILSLERLFEDIEMAGSFWEELPKVEAVTSLLLRRQTRRRWAGPGLEQLLDHFPKLQEIYYEPWREWSRLDQRWTDEDTEWLFHSLIPNKIRRMVIFEDFNDAYITLYQEQHRFLDADFIRESNFAMSRELAKASLDLEHLSASFLIDARHFFQACESTWVWSKLKSIAITSRILSSDKDSEKIKDALRAAAVTALQMSKLETMEIWNYERGLACVFRYQVFKGEKPTITWRSNWDWSLELDFRVIQSWEAVALRRTSSPKLQVFHDPPDIDVSLKSHGDAIHYLGLVQEVIHPVSLWQIQKEANSL